MTDNIISKQLDTDTNRYGFIEPNAELAIAISHPNHSGPTCTFHLDVYSTHFTKLYHVANGLLFLQDGETQMNLSTVHDPINSNPFDVELLFRGYHLAEHCLHHYLELIK